jgi:murein DD-endopeptidase MepM/ murein hydrolase activator NlpD
VREHSIVDTIVVLMCGMILLGLVVIATAGTAQRVAGETLVAAETEAELNPLAVEIPTLTPLPETPTVTVTPTEARPPTETPRPTPTRDPLRSPTPTRTPRPRVTHTPTEDELVLASPSPLVPTATVTRMPTPTPRPSPDMTPHYIFQRPISSDYVDEIAVFYPYASTGEGSYPVHHGTEFVNETGTPVLAAGAGRVVVALNDEARLLGPHQWDIEEDGAFYGNVVVIEHDATYNGKKVYTLYGHMDELLTTTGTRVEAGDLIGRVGMSGIALGPHLHFEVRVGANDYHQTRNPQLWFAPKSGNGMIIGQVLDSRGNPAPDLLVSIQRDTEDRTSQYGYSYSIDQENPTPPDDLWQENFLLGEVPAGTYRIAVRVNGDTIVEPITVRDGEITWVWLQQTE